MSTSEDRLSPHNSAASENSRRSNLMTQLSQSRKKSRAEEAKTKSTIQKVALLRYYDHVQTAQEECVSIELVLYESPWKIKKKLEKSDVGSQSRLLVPKALVKTHVLLLMSNEMKGIKVDGYGESPLFLYKSGPYRQEVERPPRWYDASSRS
ncbi:hypothetical protein CRG98_038116 [Punica granatum]|uniref:Uncharacterized protein n=1 Tax=Punica granatum TaxID=22663 RepID=A0A2I0IBW0_PUNGR|nr:hypothetical protein CRG98_038116 [Punica granatum]